MGLRFSNRYQVLGPKSRYKFWNMFSLVLVPSGFLVSDFLSGNFTFIFNEKNILKGFFYFYIFSLGDGWSSLSEGGIIMLTRSMTPSLIIL